MGEHGLDERQDDGGKEGAFHGDSDEGGSRDYALRARKIQPLT
jgi:hypothetical protein